MVLLTLERLLGQIRVGPALPAQGGGAGLVALPQSASHWRHRRASSPAAARPHQRPGHRPSYEELARQRRDSDEYREGYAGARRAFLIGQAVRERRLALGLSQAELAARARMTQPALSRLEAGGVVRGVCHARFCRSARVIAEPVSG